MIPLHLTRTRVGPLRVLRFAGHDVADRLGPVRAPGDRLAVAAIPPGYRGRFRAAVTGQWRRTSA